MNENRFAKIKIADIKIDYSYQRKHESQKSKKLIKRIANNFDEVKAGALKVSERNDGYYYVIDGGHRLDAIKMRGEPMAVTCQVIGGLTSTEEAEIYLNQKESKAMTAMEYFKASLHAGDEEAINISSILNSFGLRVGKNKNGNTKTVACVTVLQKIYRARNLNRVLGFIKSCWGLEDDIVKQSHFMYGMHFFLMLAESGPTDIGDNEIISKLSQFSPLEIVRTAHSEKILRRTDLRAATTIALVNTYNHRRRSRFIEYVRPKNGPVARD